MQKGWTLRSSGLQCVAPGACQGPRLSSPPTSSRLRRASAASTPPGATTLSVPNPPRNGAGVQPRSGLWKLPDLWTRKRTRAHKVLGRRQTAAGAHSYHRPQPRPLQLLRQRPCLTQAPSLILTAAHPEWPVFKRSRLAGFQRSVRARALQVAPVCEVDCDGVPYGLAVEFVRPVASRFILHTAGMAAVSKPGLLFLRGRFCPIARPTLKQRHHQEATHQARHSHCAPLSVGRAYTPTSPISKNPQAGSPGEALRVSGAISSPVTAR
jgi:hypothetical protein